MKRLALLMLSVFVVSCTSEKAPVANLVNSNGIMGGKIIEGNDSISKSVVAIVDTRTYSSCTGTLIAENIVITAAHCLKDVNPRYLIVVFHKDSEWILSAKEQDILQAYTRRGTKAIYHEDYEEISDEESESKTSSDSHVLPGSYDIGLLKFSGSIPEGFEIAKILEDDSAIDVKDIVHLAGYGVHEVNTSDVNPDSIPNIDELIDNGEMICDERRTVCSTVDFYADGKIRKAQAPISGFTDNEFSLDESEQGTCSGDSGGPAFIQKDGEYYLYGVTSRGSMLCDGYGVYGNLSVLKDWITATIPTLK